MDPLFTYFVNFLLQMDSKHVWFCSVKKLCVLCTFVIYFSDDKNPYFKVDLGYPDEIKGVATQGKDIQDGKYWFVRSFAMSFSLDGKTWFNYTGDGSRTKVSVEEGVL